MREWTYFVAGFAAALGVGAYVLNRALDPQGNVLWIAGLGFAALAVARLTTSLVSASEYRSASGRAVVS